MAEELKGPWVSERMKAASLECSYEKRWQLVFFISPARSSGVEKAFDDSDQREDATSQLLEKRRIVIARATYSHLLLRQRSAKMRIKDNSPFSKMLTKEDGDGSRTDLFASLEIGFHGCRYGKASPNLSTSFRRMTYHHSSSDLCMQHILKAFIHEELCI